MQPEVSASDLVNVLYGIVLLATWWLMWIQVDHKAKAPLCVHNLRSTEIGYQKRLQ